MESPPPPPCRASHIYLFLSKSCTRAATYARASLLYPVDECDDVIFNDFNHVSIINTVNMVTHGNFNNFISCLASYLTGRSSLYSIIPNPTIYDIDVLFMWHQLPPVSANWHRSTHSVTFYIHSLSAVPDGALQLAYMLLQFLLTARCCHAMDEIHVQQL
ncbi:hypothetical protein C8Q75DRAFT_803838 [Abortiporus biennis]|nr:hypothetical protein C8Q75DRAFT_803838 [Abortiporus biennis]